MVCLTSKQDRHRENDNQWLCDFDTGELVVEGGSPPISVVGGLSTGRLQPLMVRGL